jgi:glycosyltransferase involved in cell wall biosynthesis
MKILLLGDIASAHLQKWAISLSEKGLEIGIFSFNHSTENWWLSYPTISIIHQTTKKSTSKSLLSKFSYLFLIGKLKKAIQSFKPDIVHAHYASSYGLIGRLSGFHPFVISAWGTDVIKFPEQTFFTKSILINNLKSADLICATSFTIKKYISKYTAKEVSIIPFGIDFNKFQFKIRTEKKELVIGCIKSLEPIYRIDLLIESFKKVAESLKDFNLKLLIVGGGSLEKQLKNQVIELGIANQVEFTGKVSHADVPMFYHKMDIFCNLSEYESFGVSIIEAMACGVPVIATSTEGAQEIISDEKTGFLIDVGNESQLTNKLQFLIQNPDKRNQLAEQALNQVVKKFNWNKNVDEMINQYSKLIASK